MFLIVSSGVFAGMMSANLLQSFLTDRKIARVMAEMEKFDQVARQTRSKDIEKLDKIINKKRGRRKKFEQTDRELNRQARSKN